MDNVSMPESLFSYGGQDFITHGPNSKYKMVMNADKTAHDTELTSILDNKK